ncbi:MAG: lysophospholipid acyltransferase family protein [Paracoccaceae bacterium]|nr:lysophospholipid acyltransferase family protein [Paracoccaceae bacterium]
MSPTWEGAPPPSLGPRGVGGWVRVAAKGAVLGTVVFGGLAVLLLLRLVEAPLHGPHRPWTPQITKAVCRMALAIIGLRTRIEGRPHRGPGAFVANHASWLDIFVLNATATLYFVAKAEVAGWPGIGWLARATGTVFIDRNRRDAARHRDLLGERVAAGHRLCFFPEGTSTDGQRVLPFKPTLFAAALHDGRPEGYRIQPVSLVYTAPEGEDARFYGWWGEMGFGEHLLTLLAAPRHGSVRVAFHAALPVSDHPDRKSLARAAETAVRSAL